MIDSSIDLAAYALRGAIILGGIGVIFVIFVMQITKILKKKPSSRRCETSTEPPKENIEDQIIEDKTKNEIIEETVIENIAKEEHVTPLPSSPQVCTEEVSFQSCTHSPEETSTNAHSSNNTINRKILILDKLDSPSPKSFEFVLRDSINVGRGKENNNWIISDDETVSTKHCKLYIENSSVYIMDLNSTNGTIVNNKLINRPFSLATGDIIRMGASQYKIVIED